MASRRMSRRQKKKEKTVRRRKNGDDTVDTDEETSGKNTTVRKANSKNTKTKKDSKEKDSKEKDSKEKEEKEKEGKKEEPKNSERPNKEAGRSSLEPNCDQAIAKFVDTVCKQGVEGLRAMFKKDIAGLCPTKTRCVTFEANKTKNRYQDVVCLEETRVKLKLDVPPSTDYIHANWVKFSGHDRIFIASQAPLDETISDFWRMLFQEQCSTVVNLTRYEEDGKAKCARYWPEQQGGYQTYGKMFINNKKTEEEGKCIIYTLEVLPDGCSNSLIVKLIHLSTWPDAGLPKSEKTVLRLLRMITRVDSLATGPVVVHCSAGISRTGAIILIDVVLQRLFRSGMNIDFVALVREMRQQRASCLQKEGQFIFVVSSILDYIRARLPQKYRKECEKFKEDFRSTRLPTN